MASHRTPNPILGDRCPLSVPLNVPLGNGSPAPSEGALSPFEPEGNNHLHCIATDEAKAEIRSAACRYCAGSETESTMGGERLTRHNASLSKVR